VIKQKFIAIITIYTCKCFITIYILNFNIISSGHIERAADRRQTVMGHMMGMVWESDGKGDGDEQHDGRNGRHDGVMGT
jgi:hypothetical protein